MPGIVMFMRWIMRQAFNCLVLQNTRVRYPLDYNFRKKNYSFTAQLNCQLMGERIYQDADGSTKYDRPFSNWRFTISQEYKWLRISTGLDNIFGVVIPKITISFLPEEGFS